MDGLSNNTRWEETKKLGSKPDLEAIETLLRLIGSPQNARARIAPST